MHAVSQILEVLTRPVVASYGVSGGSPQSSSAAASVATAGRYRNHNQHHQRELGTVNVDTEQARARWRPLTGTPLPCSKGITSQITKPGVRW